MKSLKIDGSLRTETGKKIAKNMRKDGQVPAIIYGGKENVVISIAEKDLRSIIFTPSVHLVEINIDKKSYKTIVKEIQFHPVNDRVLHVDFMETFDDRKVTIAIPVVLTGSAEGVKAGGKLSLVTRKLRVSGLPKDLPDTLKIDITDLTLGQTKMVSDVNFENLEIIEPESAVIASVKLTRVSRGMLSPEEEAAEAEPEAGEESKDEEAKEE